MYATSYMHVIISAIRNSIEILENDNLGSEVSTLQKKNKKKKKKKKKTRHCYKLNIFDIAGY